ncbi:bifunctional folylpolyglutamate synthase/dihydrofolate synthase [Calothrix sp. 336/3]|uniref:bifunctional folylpolyglutamate synthase/dihydrofolate synthase n=1 Tax=Calothrix sp. 336/3 TaxID=1337936 RepID=UPI0004E2D5BB|nr:folylpolyglutamate synthase/dihydrofolate synthase family protein [Calothrix sp. 336/3]AKG24658.1 folylpolyglutamate synthase [Calothrix sp. 336/3]
MNIDSLLQPFQRFGVNLGLERIRQLLANLGNPQERVPVIHVAGSNGKGSVCAYLSAVFTEAGYRTGRYTSPHLVDWTERICINQQPVSYDALCQLIQEVQTAVNPETESPTQFEVITAAAWLYFAQQQVDIAVVEVGLGGRLDATNVCDNPLVSVITSISREHWQQLGDTLGEIAGEKAGIIKAGCPVVMGILPEEAETVVRSRCINLASSLIQPQPAQEISPGIAKYKSITYPLPLPGQIQLCNSALALATIEIIQEKGWQISTDAIINGMGKTQWLGRMQWTTWQNHQLLIDGAHNPAAAKVLRNYIDSLELEKKQSSVDIYSYPSITWVMGILSTKDHSKIFQELLKPGDRLYLTAVPDHSSAKPEDLANLALNICPELAECQIYSDVFTALEAAFAAPHNLVCLCGSLYLIGKFLGNANSV